MRISRVNTPVQPISKAKAQIQVNYTQQYASPAIMPIYKMNFHGIWGNKTPKKQSDIQLNAHDEIISLKLADTLHLLDEKSLIIIGNPDSIFLKAAVSNQLTKEDSFLPAPKKIEKIYVINDQGTDPLIIGKGKNDKLLIYGRAINLSKENADWMYVHSHEPADYGDIIQKENKVRIKLLKTPRESNAILYDAKYPAESFLTKDAGLDGGFVPEQTHSNPETASASPKTKKSKNTEKIPHRTFDDVAGMDKTIEILKRKVLFPMLYPEAFPDNKNKGTILYGPPGTGKTLLALAIIGEAKKRKNKDIFCIQVDGGAMTRGIVGESEAEWRKIFAKLKNNQPSLLFIDEIDSILGTREKGENFEHSNKVVSQILTLTENLEKNNDKVWIIGATNRPERIDPAIKRNGRFGNLIEVPVPDEKGCLEILNHYLKDKPVNSSFDRDDFARKLFQKSATGADIAAIVAQARENLYERHGIYEKMEKGTFQLADINGLEYASEDFKI